MRTSLPRMERAGFTLVELLTVMAVMTLLGALLFPVLAQVHEQSRRTACLSRLRQLALAHQLYLQDFDARFPHWWQAAPPRPAPFGAYRFWPEFFQPYLRSPALLRDPGAPAPQPGRLVLADYALATWRRANRTRGTAADPYFRWPGPPLALAEVVRPTETVALMEGRTTAGTTQLEGWSPQGWEKGRRLRHGPGVTVAFVDGHARWLPTAELARLGTDGSGFYWYRYGSADR